jgi:hypothetical protein
VILTVSISAVIFSWVLSSNGLSNYSVNKKEVICYSARLSHKESVDHSVPWVKDFSCRWQNSLGSTPDIWTLILLWDVRGWRYRGFRFINHIYMGGRGRRRKQLLDDLRDRRGYSHLKEEALDRIKWRNRFGRGCGPVVWQNTDEWIK